MTDPTMFVNYPPDAQDRWEEGLEQQTYIETLETQVKAWRSVHTRSVWLLRTHKNPMSYDVEDAEERWSEAVNKAEGLMPSQKERHTMKTNWIDEDTLKITIAPDLDALRIASELKWQLYQNACEDNEANGAVIPPEEMPEFKAAIEAEGVYMEAASRYHGETQ